MNVNVAKSIGDEQNIGQKYYLTPNGDIVDQPSLLTDKFGNNIYQEISAGKTYYEKDGKYFAKPEEGASPVIGLADNPEGFQKIQYESKREEVQAEINVEKEEVGKQQQETAEELKKQLLGETKPEKNETLNELGAPAQNIETEKDKQVSQLMETNKQLQTQMMLILEQLKQAKTTDLLEQLKNLSTQKDSLVAKVPKYDKVKLQTLNNRRIGFSLLSTKVVDGTRKLSGPEISFRLNTRSRRRLNKTTKAFNKIGDDSDKAIRYILAKAKFWQGGAMKGGMRKKGFNILSARGFTRDKAKFEKLFKQQKEIFINNIESKFKSKSTEDQKAITAIKSRMDYYYKVFMAKHY